MNHKNMYTGSLLRLTPLDIEKDAAVVAGWTYQPDVVSQLTHSRSHPMTNVEVKKVMEEWKKNAENSGHTFVFGLRPLQDERILGLFLMTYIQWVHGAGQFNLIIGDSQDWDAFSREALDLALNYAFDELNLFRVTVRISEDDQAAYALYQQTHFYLEVRQRQAIFRDGSYIDRLSFGMLRPEWELFRSQEVA
jgi:RimJ/RimL family protein N-acetyltransferase